MNSSAPGWVYVITNPAMPDLLKVGYSMKHPSLRADELYHTNNPHPFVVQYEVLVPNPSLLESLVHSELAQFNEGKEWFRCKVSHSISEIRRVCRANRFDILFEQESNLNEDENQILAAIRNNDHDLFERIVWFFWPEKILDSSVHMALWMKASKKKYWIENYPSGISYAARIESIFKYTLQQAEILNPFAAGYLTEYILTEGKVSNKHESLRITELTIFEKKYILNTNSDLKLAKHLIKLELSRRGIEIFTTSLIEDFIEDLSYFKFNQDTEDGTKLNDDYNPIAHQLENINQLAEGYFNSITNKIKTEPSIISKTDLIRTSHEVAQNLLHSIENEFFKLKNITQPQQKIAENIFHICKTFKSKVIEIINELSPQLSPDQLSDCASILEDEKELLGAEKLYSEALHGSHGNNFNDFQINSKYTSLINFYIRHQMSENCFNLRRKYAENYARPGKHLANAAYSLALIYSSDKPFEYWKNGKREGFKDIRESLRWCKIAIDNFAKQPWNPLNQKEHDQLVAARDDSIALYKKLTGGNHSNLDINSSNLDRTNPKRNSNSPDPTGKNTINSTKSNGLIRKFFGF